MEDAEKEPVSPLAVSPRSLLPLRRAEVALGKQEERASRVPWLGSNLLPSAGSSWARYHFWRKLWVNICGSCGIARSCCNRSHGSCFWSQQWGLCDSGGSLEPIQEILPVESWWDSAALAQIQPLPGDAPQGRSRGGCMSARTRKPGQMVLWRLCRVYLLQSWRKGHA